MKHIYFGPLRYLLVKQFKKYAKTMINVNCNRGKKYFNRVIKGKVKLK
jgi:hypothetical protein